MNAEEVFEFAAGNEVASRFLAELAQRKKSYRVTTVDQARQITGATKAEIISLFKDMEELGLGNFVVGRRGGKSRFKWGFAMIDVGRAATGESSTIGPLSEADEATSSEYEEVDGDYEEGFITHTFRLRPGEDPIVISLPEDLTRREAKRLGKFISALPFDMEEEDD